MEEYNNRKAMLNNYNIDLTLNNEQPFNTQVIALLNSLDIWRTDWVIIEPVAVSFGTYGANGAVLNIYDDYTGTECATIAIKGRTTELLKRINGITRVND